MANIWDDEPDADDVYNESKLIKDLRKLVRDEKAKTAALETEVKDLRPKVRGASVSSILSGLKVNPKIAKVIPSDIEATEDGIKAWLDENGDLFGTGSTNDSANANVDSDNDDDPSGQPNVDQESAAAWQRVQSAGSQSGSTTPDAETAQLAMLQAAANAAKGNSDLYFSYLRGEVPIPTS